MNQILFDLRQIPVAVLVGAVLALTYLGIGMVVASRRVSWRTYQEQRNKSFRAGLPIQETVAAHMDTRHIARQATRIAFLWPAFVLRDAGVQRLADQVESADGCVACGSTELDRGTTSVTCRACGYVGRPDRGGTLSANERGSFYKVDHEADD